MNLDELNTSELALLAQEFDLHAHRGLDRSALKQIIEGNPPKQKERPINKRRLQIMQYIDTNWDQVAAMLQCPAKSRDTWACHACSDLQVSDCCISNPDILEKKRTQ
jgi:hypothetical protein